MEKTTKYVYLLFERPETYHHNVFRFTFADKPTAEKYIRNHYDEIEHDADAHTKGKSYYKAKLKKSKMKITLLIQKEELHYGNPYGNIDKEDGDNET